MEHTKTVVATHAFDWTQRRSRGTFDDYYYLLTHVVIDDSKWSLAPRASVNVKIARNCLSHQKQGICYYLLNYEKRNDNK